MIMDTLRKLLSTPEASVDLCYRLAWLLQHRGKTYAHALTSALPVCTCGLVAQINVFVPLAVCQLVVVKQQLQMKEKRTTIAKKV